MLCSYESVCHSTVLQSFCYSLWPPVLQKVNILMQYRSLIYAIPGEWKHIISRSEKEEHDEGDYKLIDELLDQEKPTHFTYQKLVKKSQKPAQNKWINDTQLDLDLDSILGEFLKQRKCANNNKLKRFMSDSSYNINVMSHTKADCTRWK